MTSFPQKDFREAVQPANTKICLARAKTVRQAANLAHPSYGGQDVRPVLELRECA